MARIALVQFCAGADVEYNLNLVDQQLQRAAEQQAELCVLPENFPLLDTAGMAAFAQQRAAEVIAWLQGKAGDYGLSILAGSLPMATRPDGDEVAEGRVRSTQLLIDAQGEIQARYDKLHMFDVLVDDAQGAYRESDAVEPGNAVLVAPSAVGALGMTICYDLRFPWLYQQLRDEGAEVLVVPAAFTWVTGKAHWQTLLQARAIETQCYVVGCNQTGQHSESRRSWGHSMVVSPWGEVIASLEEEEALLIADMDLDLVHEVRKKMPVQSHRHQVLSRLAE